MRFGNGHGRAAWQLAYADSAEAIGTAREDHLQYGLSPLGKTFRFSLQLQRITQSDFVMFDGSFAIVNVADETDVRLSTVRTCLMCRVYGTAID